MKFKSQREDPMNGNDFISSCLGPNAERRHTHFKRFFGVQDPLKCVLLSSTHPNWKVEPFLEWIKFVSMSVWKCGRKISVDKQTIGFQGKHSAKLRIIYKREGDRFQCNSLCDHGYIFTFFVTKILQKNIKQKDYPPCILM